MRPHQDFAQKPPAAWDQGTRQQIPPAQGAQGRRKFTPKLYAAPYAKAWDNKSRYNT